MIRTAHRSIATIVLLVLNTPAFPDDTLCSASEDAVFSCPVERGKILSVCASSSSQKVEKIAYRFGTLKKIDLDITADSSPETTTVEYNVDLQNRAYNMFVRFKSGEYAYTVQQRWNGVDAADDSFFAGVIVYKASKFVARHECGVRISMDFELLKRSRIPVSDDWPE